MKFEILIRFVGIRVRNPRILNLLHLLAVIRFRRVASDLRTPSSGFDAYYTRLDSGTALRVKSLTCRR